jgi:receptor expression-enhancing protein 1/2/3/4
VAKHESEIDQNLNELSTRAGDIALLWWQRGSGYAQARFYELLQFLASQSNRAQQISASTQGTPGAPPRPSTQAPPRGHVPQVRLLPYTFATSVFLHFLFAFRCYCNT